MERHAKKDVQRVCESCEECLMNKRDRRKSKMTSIVSLRPWNIIGVDVVGPFPESSEHVNYKKYSDCGGLLQQVDRTFSVNLNRMLQQSARF